MQRGLKELQMMKVSLFGLGRGGSCSVGGSRWGLARMKGGRLGRR